jgi:uncharacterized protein involved in type VI secretion and phage assembly
MVRGAVIGLVTNNQDPDNHGRIKVRYPWLGDTIESHWARVVCLYAGPDRGGYILPEVGDEVLVMFERGDPAAPYVVGSLWNGVDTVPGPGNPDGENNTKWWQSRSGHKYIFIDEPGNESITLVDKSGKLTLNIDVPKDLITLEATTGDLYFKAPEGPINMESKTMEIKASNSSTVTVGNALTEISKTRTEKVGGTCSATAEALWQMGTKTLSVKFGGVDLKAETATMVVEGSTNQTMGNTKLKADTIHRNSGPETVSGGSVEVHAKRLEVIANSQTLVAGSVSISSGGDAKMTSTACLTVMGGMTSFNAGAAMTTQANTVTLS